MVLDAWNSELALRLTTIGVSRPHFILRRHQIFDISSVLLLFLAHPFSLSLGKRVKVGLELGRWLTLPSARLLRLGLPHSGVALGTMRLLRDRFIVFILVAIFILVVILVEPLVLPVVVGWSVTHCTVN